MNGDTIARCTVRAEVGTRAKRREYRSKQGIDETYKADAFLDKTLFLTILEMIFKSHALINMNYDVLPQHFFQWNLDRRDL